MIGCGNSRARRIDGERPWDKLVTLDIDPDTGCDVVHDLEVLPYPFADQEFDEIHAYEVLEHVGRQGDWRFFFAQFSELDRILKPGGRVFITVPPQTSPWAWGDPGHTRILPMEIFSWLDQDHYKQVGTTACTDYRFCWKGDLKAIHVQKASEHCLAIVLEKPL